MVELVSGRRYHQGVDMELPTVMVSPGMVECPVRMRKWS